VTAATVTFVLPCFNEGARIVASLATLQSWFGATHEILVVDDGSADDTAAKVESYAEAHAHIRVHRVRPHRGKGRAVREAIPRVRTERVVFMDADLAFDCESVQRTLDALGDADVVVGNRRDGRSRYSVPVQVFGFLYRRHFAGLAFNAFVRALTGVSVRDTQCGLKGYRREGLVAIAPALSVDGFALDVEMLLVASSLGLRMTEIPVNVRYESARSSVRMLASTRRVVSDVMAIALRRARGAYAPARIQVLAAPMAGADGPVAE
jgi:glycosyltransferase involved in cell wall biosynthesis